MSDHLTFAEMHDLCGPVEKYIREAFFPQGRFTAHDVYLSELSPPDLTMYAVLNDLVAEGELEYLGPENPIEHTQMIYQVTKTSAEGEADDR